MVTEPFRPLTESLLAVLRPVSWQDQVIHGDLTGNILFAADLTPAVIDFSPYFRPAGFALAIVVVDAVAWHGAPLSLAEHLDHVHHIDQLIARAAIYRLVTADQSTVHRGSSWAERQVSAHRTVLALVGA